MTELPTVSGQRVVRALARVGFINRSDYRQSCVTPTVAARQSRYITRPDVAKGTLRSILAYLQLTIEELGRLL